MNKSKLASRTDDILPFYVMDILVQAKQVEAQDEDITRMEVEVLDFETPQPIIEAGIQALKSGKINYTPALGLLELRETIANWYQTLLINSITRTHCSYVRSIWRIIIDYWELVRKKQKSFIGWPRLSL